MAEFIAVATAPDRIALALEGRDVSYREFSARVATLARDLIGRGVGPEVAVAVCIERSAELLIAIHAIVAAGGQYVPLDVDAPAERTRYMLDTAGASTVLIRAGSAPESLDGIGDIATCLEVDASVAVDEDIAPVTDADRISPIRPGTAVYTLFTSGSTGRPKGVTITHEAIVNRLEWMREWYGLTGDHVFLQKTPVTFDVSVWELFLPFRLGAPLVIAEAERHGDAPYLAEVIRARQVSVIHFVPSMLSAFVDALGEDVRTLQSLRLVFTSGEALTAQPSQALLGALESVRLINLYGPTEAAVDVTAHEVKSGDLAIPIGGPVPNTTTVILDRLLQLVPKGVPGELYLGGIQLARGYASRPDLSADRFVADPYGPPGARLYRTGDMARWNADGEIEYLGRTDFQVKLRGQRLELGEVETALAAVPGVVHAAATVGKLAGADHLVAYLAPATVDLDAAKATVARLLPEYMRPTVWMPLDKMPLNNSGKVNRRKLPKPTVEKQEYVAPENDTEAQVATLFGELLRQKKVSVTQSFFDLGGTSLGATRLAARVGKALGVDVSVRDVFDAPSVRELLAAVSGKSAGLAPVTAVVPRPEHIPLSFAQQRMWFINQFDPVQPTYNIPAVLRVSGSLDIDALRAAVLDVAGRHEVLRTCFPAIDGVPYQVIGDIAEAGERQLFAEVDSEDDLFAAVVAGFDVTRDWPLRVRVHTAGSGERLLAVVAHHIGVDGESMLPLVTDIVTAYTARADGSEPSWAPLEVQFADFALWQHEALGSFDDAESVVASQLAYWKKRLGGLPDVLELPADRVRPAVASHRGASVEFAIPADLAGRIESVATQVGGTPFMVVHAALAVLLARLSASGDIAVSTPIAGRGDRILDPLVGMFVNTLVLRADVRPGMSFTDLLDQVRETDLDAFAHADVPFETVVDALNPVRSEAFAPLAQVTLTFDPAASASEVDVTVGDLVLTPVAAPMTAAQVDVMVAVSSAPSGLPWAGSLIYATDLFNEPTVRSMADRFLALLDALTAAPGAAVGDVDVLTGADREVLAALPVPVVPEEHSGLSLVEVFAGPAREHADEPAVTAGGETLTYAELDARAGAVAAGLASRGVRVGDLVGVATARSVDVVVAIVGVLKAGAAYVPLDVTNPVGRLEHIVSDSGVGMVLTDSSTTGHGLWDVVPEGVDVVDVTALSATGEALDPVVVHPDSCAYVIYTSGSTGLPKGVEVTHRDVVTLLDATAGDFDFGPDDVWTMFHSYAFDFSVWELWGALFYGGRCVIVDRDLARDVDAFVELVIAEGVTVINQTPSAFYQLIDARRRNRGEWLVRYFVFGGEALSFEQVRRWFDLFPDDTARLVNMYGITETTVHVSYRELDRMVVSADDGSLIGRPLSSLGIRVLDTRLRPVPIGVVGEMYVSGGQLARGYLGRPDLTATRFVADPDGAPGDRLYRTGDLARRVGGDIEYLGRGDSQVQLRGFRIEFGEVEAALLGADGVVGAAARIIDGAAGEVLVGYVVADAGAAVDQVAVRDQASRMVPAYMVPSVVVEVDALPLTANGKLDRNALPEPDFGAAGETFAEAADDTEAAVAAAFADVLGAERVSVTGSFFELGGNSLSAMRLAARVSEALGVAVSVRDVFDAPSVRELIAAVAGGADALAPVTAAEPRPERIPLSFGQLRMWFLNRFDPGLSTYNIPAVLRLSGSLDAAALHAAVIDVVVRHEVLRTSFPAAGGVPYQSIALAEDVAGHLDWVVVSSQAEVEAAVTTGFDLTTEWPIRFRLWHTGDDYVFALVAHHIAADGESMAPLVTDLVTAYAARAAGQAPAFAPLEVQFADYAIWQHEVLGSPEDPESPVGRQLAYWTGQLAGLPDLLELPADRPRPPVASQRGAVTSVPVPAELSSAIEELATEADVTPFMVFHAALAVLLSRLSGADDVAVGTSVAGRGQAVLDPLVGMFVNTIVLRTRIEGAQSFRELLAQVRTTDMDGYSHAELPFETLVETLNPARSEAFAPLAQVLLFFNNGAPARPVAVSDITVSPVEAPAVTARVDLTVGVGAPPGEPWGIALEYATDLFDAATVDAFGARLLSLLSQVTADPETLVGDCDLLLASDAVSGDIEWGPRRSVPAGTVADAVAAQIARTPDATALRYEDREVTYREFGARVNVLARSLIAAGVGPESAVAVCIPRSVEMMVAIHAVIAAGGQYVPIATDAPADRVQYMFDTAGVGVVLVADTTSHEVSRLVASAPHTSTCGNSAADNSSVEAPRAQASGLETPQAENVRTIVVDCSGYCDLAAPPVTDADRLAPLTPENAVYTLFTSGSTGRPKGVTLTHEAVVNRLWWGLDELPIDPSDTVVQKTPYTFDCSVPELLAPLMVGATLVVLRDGGHLEPLYVADVIERTGATMVHFVPSMLSVFLDLVGTQRLAAMSSIRIISTTGEALPPGVASQVREALPHILFYNLYGPTEAAVEITYEKIEAVAAGDLSVPIGVPVWNSSAVILDARLHRVPDGVPGELYLGGVQLARGYAARGDLTADRFIADPYGAPGARLYRTGDLVRRAPDGRIDYLGRTDFQVKLRGQRIELGEIESVLASAPGVVHAAATVADGPGGSQHLVGYLAGRPGQRPDVAAVSEAARQSLPVYMVPSVWMVLDDIALNSAGKLDRKALPEPDFASVEAEFEAPATDAEEAVAAAFADVLGVDKVSVTGSFFDLGGNSLSAMRLAARAGDVLGVDISVRDIFEAPTVRGLVAAASGLGSALTPITAADPRPQRIPLSFAQQRMWFINQFDPAQPTYNIPAILRLRGSLDVAALRAAVADVVARQEILRTSFPAQDGTPYQLIGDMAEFDERSVWRKVGTDEEVFAAAATGFDVTSEWPLRVVLREAAGDHLLAVVVHHIGADAESLAPLVTDIVTAYAARAAGEEPRQPALRVQFADYAIWQHEVLGSTDDATSVVGRQLDYWRTHLAGLPDVLELPADRARPPVASHLGARATAQLPPRVAQRVDALARDLGASPFMVIHAALAVLLARLSATDDIAVATPISNRGQDVLSPLIGMFVNTLVLRSVVDPDEPFTALLDRTRTDDLDGFAHADIPFETLVEKLDPVRSEAFSPLAQVMLNFNPGASVADTEVNIAGLEVMPVTAPVVPAQLDLSVVVSQAPSGQPWPLSVLYATDLFDAATIDAFCERLVAVIDALTSDPTRAVGDAPLLIGAEHEQVTAWSGGPDRDAPERSAVDWLTSRHGGAPEAAR